MHSQQLGSSALDTSGASKSSLQQERRTLALNKYRQKRKVLPCTCIARLGCYLPCSKRFLFL